VQLREQVSVKERENRELGEIAQSLLKTLEQQQQQQQQHK
jgi:hypothetical protein